MKYLDTYEMHIINESLSDFLKKENRVNFYKSVQSKTINKLGLQLYFVGTFQMGVTVIYPVVESLVKNSNIPNITPETIVLMTVFSIAQILNVFNDDVKKIKTELEKENLLETTELVKKNLMSIFKIFSFVSRSFGKIIDVFTDMLAYVGLGAPIFMALIEIISIEGLDLENLPRKVLIFGGAAGVFALKSIVETIIDIIKNKYRF